MHAQDEGVFHTPVVVTYVCPLLPESSLAWLGRRGRKDKHVSRKLEATPLLDQL